MAGGRRRGRRLPTPGLREAARLHPSARPGPTVEFEMADALALGVPGRSAAEAAPQGLALAALRPPAAAREGYRQQPQAAHARSPLHRAPGNRLGPACSPRRQRGAGRRPRGRGAGEGRPMRRGASATGPRRQPIIGRGGRDAQRGRSPRSPAVPLVRACFECSPPGMLFGDARNHHPSNPRAFRHSLRPRAPVIDVRGEKCVAERLLSGKLPRSCKNGLCFFSPAPMPT